MSDSQSAPTQSYELPSIERPASVSPTEDQLRTEAVDVAHDPYVALRLKDFQLYLLGWVLSVIGGQIQEVAVGWDIFQRAQREGQINPFLSLGLVGGVVAAPIILLAIPAGTLADRFDRRKLIVI